MKTSKVTKQTGNVTTLLIALLASFSVGLSFSSQAMDLSAQSDLVESSLSASILHNASNISFITQLGSNNRAEVTQSGDNLVTITELGNNNVAVVHQEGLGNIAIVTQVGNGNDIEITQIGSSNMAVTTQIGGPGYKVVQIGDNMRVFVTQYEY